MSFDTRKFGEKSQIIEKLIDIKIKLLCSDCLNKGFLIVGGDQPFSIIWKCKLFGNKIGGAYIFDDGVIKTYDDMLDISACSEHVCREDI